MNRRRFLATIQTIGISRFLQAGKRFGTLAAAFAPLPPNREQQRFRIKVFGPGTLRYKIFDYSPKYVPVSPSRAPDNIRLGELTQAGSLTYGWTENGEKCVLIASGVANVSEYEPELLSRLRAYVRDADVLIGTGELGEPDRATRDLLAAVSTISQKTAALRIAVVTFPFSFYGDARRGRALADLDAVKRQYDLVSLLPMDNVFKSLPEEVSILEAFAALDQLLHETLTAIVDSLFAANTCDRASGIRLI